MVPQQEPPSAAQSQEETIKEQALFLEDSSETTSVDKPAELKMKKKGPKNTAINLTRHVLKLDALSEN